MDATRLVPNLRIGMSSTPAPPLEPLGYTPLGKHAFMYRPPDSAEFTASDDATQAADPTLVFVFGWMAARRSHLLKYTETYRTLYPGATIIVLRSHLSFFFVSRAILAERFHPVIEVLEALGCFEGQQRILTHSFSNGGSLHILALNRLLASKQKVTTPIPPSALIIDSSPGGTSIYRIVLALVSPIQNKPIRLLSRLLATIVLSLLYIVLGVLLRRPSAIERMISTLSQRRLLPWLDTDAHTQSPRLYVYSKRDEMVPWRDIEKHFTECERAGMDVRKVRFEGSPHVAHARMYPKEYWGAVRKVWEDACRAAGELA
ncbi:hypothetical protein C8F01DRAFT_1154732 [Mycena amicta]|nr:hypothetical protein C8F01DRAFT_1154732 [Mycena amicta]